MVTGGRGNGKKGRRGGVVLRMGEGGSGICIDQEDATHARGPSWGPPMSPVDFKK